MEGGERREPDQQRGAHIPQGSCCRASLCLPRAPAPSQTRGMSEHQPSGAIWKPVTYIQVLELGPLGPLWAPPGTPSLLSGQDRGPAMALWHLHHDRECSEPPEPRLLEFMSWPPLCPALPSQLTSLCASVPRCVKGKKDSRPTYVVVRIK